MIETLHTQVFEDNFTKLTNRLDNGELLLTILLDDGIVLDEDCDTGTLSPQSFSEISAMAYIYDQMRFNASNKLKQIQDVNESLAKINRPFARELTFETLLDIIDLIRARQETDEHIDKIKGEKKNESYH